MSNKHARIGFRSVALAVFCITLLGGCTPAESAAFQALAADLLRNAVAALLL